MSKPEKELVKSVERTVFPDGTFKKHPNSEMISELRDVTLIEVKRWRIYIKNALKEIN